LQAIQNAAAASGGDITDKFQRINYAIAELNSGIPVSARQLRQLATAGVPLQAIADQLGITTEALFTAGKTGVVTAEQIVTAFQYVYTHGNLGDFMKSQSNTFSGAMSLIKTNLGLAIAQGFGPLFTAVSNVVVKIGQFVQTATFRSWVTEATRDIGEVINIFKTFMGMLEPIGAAIAKVFGFKTNDISKEMADVAKAGSPNVGAYDPTATKAVDETKAQLAGYKQKAADATKQIADLNGEINSNNLLLDQNARNIQGVKDKWDPTINSATEAIRKIGLLTPEEEARKTRELQLDKNKANLELTKPDTSSYDAKILSDQTTLDNMPRLDTSTWDTNISGYQKQITDLQDSISSLNTDEFDRKINAIKDKLAEPAPDTQGITNQLKNLEDQLAGGKISQSAFDTSYGALSRQKQGINTQYTEDKTGLTAQLKLLTQQRADQVLANQETARADKASIDSLKDKLSLEEAGRKKAVDDDAKARQALQDDIKKEGNLRTQALAPYTEAMKKITDEQAHNAALDAAATAQRTLALAPYKKALDEANQAKAAGLLPLDAEKERLDGIKTSLNEQKATQTNIKQEAEASAAALKSAGANTDGLNNSLKDTGPLAKSISDSLSHISDKLPAPDSPFVTFLKAINSELAKMGDWVDNTALPALGRFAGFIGDHVLGPLGDFYGWLEPKIVTGLGDLADAITNTVIPRLQDFWHWIQEQTVPALQNMDDLIVQHIKPTLTDLGSTIATVATPAFSALWDMLTKSVSPALLFFGNYVDQVLAPILKTFVSLALEPVRLAFDAEHLLITNFVKPAIHDLGVVFDIEVRPLVDKLAESFGKFNTILTNLKNWIDSNWGGIGNALSAPFKMAFGPIAGFFTELGKGINWLGKHFKLPTIEAPPLSQSLDDSSGGGSLPGHSGGLNFPGAVRGPMPGHWALTGEKGPEPIFVPAGASIVPNDMAKALGMIPGHADGLNLDFLDSFLSSIGNKLKGAASGLVGTLMDHLGTPDIPGLPEAGKALAGQVKSGLLDWLRGSGEEQGQSLGRSFANFGGGSGAFSGYADLIEQYAAQYGVPDDIIGAIILHESSGIIGRIEDGGGLGRGLMQMDIGQNPGYNSPLLTDTSRAGADYQIRTGTELLAGMLGAANGNIEDALTSYTGAGFIAKNNGLDFYQVLMSQGFDAQARALLDAAMNATNVQPGGGSNDVLADATKYLGSRAFLDANGMTYCEGFLDTIREDFGIGRKGFGSAIEHAQAVLDQLQSGPASAGDEAFFANVNGATGWSPYGHTGVAVGDGTYISALGSGITHNVGNWEANPGYLGHAPIALADGGYFPRNDPRFAMIGEGASDEVASPVPVMEDAMRRVLSGQGGGAPSITFQPGAITVDAGGNVTVNPAKVDILGAWHASGHL
jgi:tape measure domain-containing protein